ncbi:2-hydroxyacid dehydrogenase [Ancylobacter lacus]|uniref:2-hydroxyacid dehydrogenase n=1 Tax=Ancylobacter lacus TaxID=2579970 RepID=UPI001BCF7C78|nr:D-glycerate dehydrogenase [Ancylobacter lacus]MBS7540475.1 D-glycerate dehydrogenase [Ancylobacter lacus]
MARKKPLVVVTRKLPDKIETRMRELFDARLNVEDVPLDRARLAEAVATADVLVPTIADRIDAEVLAHAGPNLKLIANFGNGVDHIDVAAATERGITVTNTPGVLTEDTADMTMALILAVPRRLTEGAAMLTQDDGFWPGWSPTWMLGHRIWGKRLGIIGMGRIGQAVARRAKAFGLQIHYHNRHPLPAHIEEEVEATYWDSLDQMLARMDILSVNCPHTPATYHLLSARRLKLVRRDAYIVNTARGEVIDEAALARMIETGELAGAGLDVFEREPAVSPKLLKLARQGKVVLLPHMGSATVEARIDTGEKVIVNIRAFIDGHRPPDRVLAAML